MDFENFATRFGVPRAGDYRANNFAFCRSNSYGCLQLQAPHEIGRAQFGRISITNSGSEARAYIDAAIDAGWRAVEEQTRL